MENVSDAFLNIPRSTARAKIDADPIKFAATAALRKVEKSYFFAGFPQLTRSFARKIRRKIM
jgi:hypothetical protein